jgi:c-di-GMP-binding flagellar brake protein YcgR
MVFASHVEILNLSLGGMAITADRRLNIGTEYSVTLKRGPRTVNVTGVVAWSALSSFRKEAGGESVAEYSAGIRFTHVVSENAGRHNELIGDDRFPQEKRLDSVRFKIESAAAVLDRPETYKVKLISLAGMLIETGWAMATKSVHTMQIQIESDQPPISFRGRVASCRPAQEEGHERYEIGIEFVEVSAPERSRLEAFVAAAAASESEQGD